MANGACAMPSLSERGSVGWEDLPVDVMQVGAKPPCPPRDKLLASYNLATVDKHVAQLSSSLLEGTLADLVQALLSPTKGDKVCAARAIFAWIASHPVTLFDVQDRDVTPGCPMQWLLKLKHRQIEYSELFSEMCRNAGIPNTIIHGYVKGAKYQVGQPLFGEYKSTWNAIYIKDSWRLVDCLWGSRHVITIAEDDWTLVDGVGHCNKPCGAGQEFLHYQCNDFYFLTDPDQFIFSHYPTDNDDWQLLKKAVTLEEWTDMVYVKPVFFEAGLKLLSHPRGLITADNSNVEVKISCPSTPSARYKSKLFSERSSHDAQPRCLDKYVLTRRRGSLLSCKVRIPTQDIYRLEVYVWNREENAYMLALIYKISAVKGCYGDVTPLPGDNEQVPWGPQQDLDRELGIQAISHKEGVIQTSTGEVEIRFKVPDCGDIKLFYELSTFNKKPDQLSNQVVHYVNKAKGEIIFRTLLDEPGEHALSIGLESLTKQKQVMCKYLIQMEQDPTRKDESASRVKNARYPALPGGKLGDTEVAEKWGVTMSPDDPWITKKDNSEMRLQASTSKVPLQFACQMTLAVADASVEVNDYVCCTNRSNGAEVLVRFPHPGLYHLAVHARPANVGTPGEAYFNVYNYFIHVLPPSSGKKKNQPLPFPTTFTTWKDDFKLSGPANGLLPKNSTIRFSVQVPGASEVSVVGATSSGQQWTPMSKTSGDRWKADVATEDTDSLHVCATFQEAKDGHQRDFSSLLQFEVMEAQDIKTYFQKRIDVVLEDQQPKSEGAIPKKPTTASGQKSRKICSADRKERRRKAREIFENEIRQRLHEALEAGTRQALEGAVKSFRDHNLKDSDGVFEHACALLDFLRASDSLKESIASKSLDRLRVAIRNIEKKQYEDRLVVEMSKARKLLVSLEKIDCLRRDVLSMDPTTWAEVRRYTSPLSTIHDVIRGALLLLGDHEGKTGKWPSCQTLLCNLGSEGLNRRVTRFDVDELHAEVAARARDILYPLKLSEVCELSLGVGTFYKWAVGMLEERFSRYRHEDPAKPADITRQREIFNDFEPELFPAQSAIPTGNREDTLMAVSPFAVSPGGMLRPGSRSHMRREDLKSKWTQIVPRLKDLKKSQISPRRANQK